MERTFNAPRSLVWEAWTKAEHIASWWGPQGMKTKVIELDFRAGGNWRYLMTAPNGFEFPTFGKFTEIVEQEKIVCTADFAEVTVGVVMSIEFLDLGEKTKMVFKVIHNTAEYARQQREMGSDKGWGSTFDRLSVFLESANA
jgi:uncharacterized protein YndB with AHSA1/START domain